MTTSPKDSKLLELKGISKTFGNTKILDQVSLCLRAGEVLSLLGISGSGKTTLFNIAAGLLSPDEGEVQIKGKPLKGPGQVAYMLQKDLLLPHLSLLDNVCLPLIIMGEKKKKAREQAKAFFKDFGLEGHESSYPSALSGGMAQRAAFLRTYLFSSDIALLDEPFSALDAITKQGIHRWYLETMEQLHLSTLLITHDIDEAIELSDRILVLSGRPAKIVEEIEISKAERIQRDFNLSPAFLTYKRQLLKALSLD